MLLLAAPLLLADAEPVVIPPAIKSMLDAAISSGNDSDIAVIVKYARTADPATGDAVQAIVDHWRAARNDARTDVIREARFIDLWKGSAQLGGYITTGNSDTAGVTGALDLSREGLKWRHKIRGQFDYQESLGIATRKHYLAAYEPNRKISDRAYVYGSLQYESDRFLGYDDRFSTSVGYGYTAIKRPKMTLDLELGPAYRATSFTDDTVEHSIAARGNLDFAWKLTPGLSFTQAASAYVERYNSTLSGTSALNAKLLGPLSAQLSYNVQYESMPPLGSKTTDTTGRAALVYSF